MTAFPSSTMNTVIEPYGTVFQSFDSIKASLSSLSSTLISILAASRLINSLHCSNKVVLGMGVVVSTAYYIYTEYFIKTLSSSQIAFLNRHKEEIEKIYESKKVSGKWQELGSGVSKIAFTHPEFPGMLIKIPGKWDFGSFIGEDNLLIHNNNLESLRGLAARFDRIVLPESYLFSTSKGLLLVEEKFIFEDFDNVPEGSEKQELLAQFKAFENRSNLLDIDLSNNANCGIIFKSNPLKVGIIDFDHMSKQSKWDWNFRNPNSHFFVKSNVNQISLLIFATGAAFLKSVALITQKISKINPNLILTFGFTLSTISNIYLSKMGSGQQPAGYLAMSGITCAATSLTIVPIGIYSLINLARRIKQT